MTAPPGWASPVAVRKSSDGGRERVGPAPAPAPAPRGKGAGGEDGEELSSLDLE